MTLKFNLRQNYSNEKFFTKISKFTFLQKFYILNFIHFLYFIQYFSIFYIIIDERDKKEVDMVQLHVVALDVSIEERVLLERCTPRIIVENGL